MTEAAQIEITPAMIRAGLFEIGEFRFGCSMAELVEAIYLAMEIERREAPSPPA